MTVVLVGSVEVALSIALCSGASLTPREKERYDLYRDSDARALFAASHLLARVCLAEVSRRSPGEFNIIQTCPSCGGPHGRPNVVGPCPVSVAISHAGRYIAVAASKGEAPVGVDIEPFNSQVCQRMSAIASRILAQGEEARLERASDPGLELLRIWVRKEALIKTGTGSLDEMNTFLAYPPEGRGSVGLRLHDFQFEEYVGAVVSASVPTIRHLD